MDNKLRYFLTSFFGSLGIFILITYGHSLISGGDRSLIAITGRILIYFTVPVFVLVAMDTYRPGLVSKKVPSVYVQVVQSIVLLVVMLTLWSALEGRGSRYLQMGFFNYWLRVLQGYGFAIVYFSLAIPILLKLSMRRD